MTSILWSALRGSTKPTWTLSTTLPYSGSIAWSRLLSTRASAFGSSVAFGRSEFAVAFNAGVGFSGGALPCPASLDEAISPSDARAGGAEAAGGSTDPAADTGAGVTAGMTVSAFPAGAAGVGGGAGNAGGAGVVSFSTGGEPALSKLAPFITSKPRLVGCPMGAINECAGGAGVAFVFIDVIHQVPSRQFSVLQPA